MTATVNNSNKTSDITQHFLPLFRHKGHPNPDPFAIDDAMDDSEIDIWASPTQDAPLVARPKTPKTPRTPTGEDAEPVSRDAQLRKELEGVRGVNESMEGLIETLKRADGNMMVRH